MLDIDALMLAALGEPLCLLQRLLRFLREAVDVHADPFPGRAPRARATEAKVSTVLRFASRREGLRRAWNRGFGLDAPGFVRALDQVAVARVAFTHRR